MLMVENVIGERYKEGEDNDDWAGMIDFQHKGYGGGNCIFISAPTGSGKTSFILGKWMKYMADKQMKVLYLVNRSLLKEQLKEKIGDEYLGISYFIDIKLYQDVERELKAVEKEQGRKERKLEEGFEKILENKFEKKLQEIKKRYSEYTCVVCDECHYFLADSNFNTNTALSFRWIQDCFSDKIRIFMSATIEDIELYLMAYDEERRWADKRYKYYLPDTESIQKEKIMQKSRNDREYGKVRLCKYLEYKINRNYDYIDVDIIYIKYKSSEERGNEIIELIEAAKKTEKWLIFVDNSEFGKDLSNKIGNEAVFISAKNKEEEEVSQALNEIKYNEKTRLKRVVITTSVMDNGINIKDSELRNIILMADTETEFIQMLGRKRRDGEKFKLYIYQYDKKHFEKRLKDTKQILRKVDAYFNDLVYYKDKYKNHYNEELVIIKSHINLMRDIFDNKSIPKYIEMLFNNYGGTLYLSPLAYQNLKNMGKYYENVIKAFDLEKDNTKKEDSFIRTQLGWLGIEGEKAEEIIKKSHLTMVEKCREEVIAAFEQKCDVRMYDKEATDFQIGIRDALIVLIDSTKGNEMHRTAREQGGKSKCPLSEPTVKYLCKYCGIPYQMTVDRDEKGRYYIIRKEDWKPDAEEKDKRGKQPKLKKQ